MDSFHTIGAKLLKLEDIKLHQKLLPNMLVRIKALENGQVETEKEMVEEVDDELQKTVFKVIEGGVLEVYNPLILTINMEDMGHKKLVIWTIDFKKVNG
uniref:Bet v I/Major latex protein domain-containing protein n=1 Tax=Lactuca sativa TaxID=4236 RepID=A0A9R1XU97_LACSA|nr:hypothetical protein LSAT_V11C300116980 [Lactuca sativa]